jgi:hypothetical protein
MELQPYWGQAIPQKHLRPAARELGIETRFGWHTFRHSYSTLLRSVGTEFKVMQELLRHHTQAITPAKQNPQGPVMSLVFCVLSEVDNYYKDAPCLGGPNAKYILSAKYARFAPDFSDFASPNHPVSSLE